MLKVLLVEDESFERQYLETVIDWEQYGFYICGEADNGRDGLELIRKYSPNLVVTDIKMPEIDGLEMIKMTAEEIKAAPKFVIISGHDDFKYAKTAIKYNVVDFVLKPIDENEFTELLKKVKDEIYEELKNDEEFSVSIKTRANEAFKKLLEGEINENVLLFANRWLGLYENEDIYCVLVEIDNYDSWKENLSENNKLLSSRLIENLIYEIIGAGNSLNVYRVLEYRYGLLVNKNILEQFNNDIKAFVKRLYSNFTNNSDLKISIYVSKKITSLCQVKTAYQNCRELIQYLYTSRDKHRIIFYDDVKDTTFSYSVSNLKYFHLLHSDIEKNNIKGIKLNIDRLFREAEEKRIDPKILRAYIVKFELELFTLASQWLGDDKSFHEKVVFPDIGETRFNIIKDNFIKFCTDYAGYIHKIKQDKSNGLLCAIESYIHKNYKTDISLKSIADAFYINPVYLGQLFKKTYGVYFNDYLHQLRIEEAKKLLKMTNLKIYEVASEIGYTDSNYFTVKFEKLTGLTPSQFKRKYSK